MFSGILVLLISGCASYGVVDNEPGAGTTGEHDYSLKSFMEQWRTSDNALMLAFSGGGSRAAALSYGVLKELRDTPVEIEGRAGSLLDEIHSISSVSGGSFTAAYYGLYGDAIFEDYEEVFLRKNVEGALLRGLLNPLRWFSTTGRTEMAVRYYEQTIFNHATFSDMRKSGGPMVLINASDLGYGVRFSFVQEYFNLLCSDLSSFPVARAVTASSAVPVLFNPVVVQNFPECGREVPKWLEAVQARGADNLETAILARGLSSYYERDRRKFVHFVDGGITDNLGLRALYDFIELVGGVTEYAQKYKRQPPRRLVLITVNASTDPDSEMGQTRKQPSLMETVGAISDVQLHRYNVATIELIKRSMKRWAQEWSTPARTVTPYFIQIDFREVQDPDRRRFLNQTPTNFNLSDEQVDRLIEAGGELLRNNPEFQRLLSDLEADRRQTLNQGSTRFIGFAQVRHPLQP
jgi:NTE family protein